MMEGTYEALAADYGAHMDQAIIVWRFEDAPEELRAMSYNCGDEDWLAILPDHIEYSEVDWMTAPSSFARCELQCVGVVHGRQVVIGVHS